MDIPHRHLLSPSTNTSPERDKWSIKNFLQTRLEKLGKEYEKLLANTIKASDTESKAVLFHKKSAVLSEQTNLAADLLYKEVRELPSHDARTETARAEIAEIYNGEMGRNRESESAITDPEILALIRTRNAEFERLKLKLEIWRLEKKIYDLQSFVESGKRSLVRESGSTQA